LSQTIPVSSTENVSPNISLWSGGITITHIVEEVSVPKMRIDSASRKQNNNAFWEEFWEKRMEVPMEIGRFY
jgi:hypothetical protein